MQQQLASAKEQLRRYTHAPSPPFGKNTTELKRVALVYAGWELIKMEEV